MGREPRQAELLNRIDNLEHTIKTLSEERDMLAKKLADRVDEVVKQRSEITSLVHDKALAETQAQRATDELLSFQKAKTVTVSTHDELAAIAALEERVTLIDASGWAWQYTGDGDWAMAGSEYQWAANEVLAAGPLKVMRS